MTVRVLTGDCRDVLATLPDRSVQCCVTSPPYFGLRDYGTATWDGGDAGCDHKHQLGGEGEKSAKQNTSAGMQSVAYRDFCRKCGATRIDQQIGLEQTPDAYVAEMVAVFREVRRVLRDDGVCFINLGDSYASSSANGGQSDFSTSGLKKDGRPETSRVRTLTQNAKENNRKQPATRRELGDVKPKDLLGIPWLVAFALRADGWYLRQDIIWAKPNPMPESVTDRCTKAHEYVFLLSKSARYFYDAKAVAEPATGRETFFVANGGDYFRGSGRNDAGSHNPTPTETRNKRSVWSIASQPYSGAHFATMPADLAETCIKAGSSERGQCPTCGAPWVRQTETERLRPAAPSGSREIGRWSGGDRRRLGGRTQTQLTGWAQSCACPAHAPVPQMILDPFGGAGTTALVADRLQRDATVIELNPAYAALLRERVTADAGMFAQLAAE